MSTLVPSVPAPYRSVVSIAFAGSPSFTPVQAAVSEIVTICLPVFTMRKVLETDESVVVAAPTGSGKTGFHYFIELITRGP